MLLHDLVVRAAAAHPDRAALVVDDHTTTYAELDRRTAALATAVAAVSEPGDRVAVVADNDPAWVDAYYGVPRGGRVLGFVNHRLGPDPMRASVARLRPSVLIAGRDQLDALATTGPVADLAPVVVAIDRPVDGEIRYERFLADAATGPVADAAPAPSDTAWLIATSGTSGTPKVVELTHASLLAAVTGTLAVRPTGPDDAYLFPFPLCHVAGYNVVLFHHQARPVVLPRRFTPADFVDQVHRHGVTNVSLAPTMIDALLDHLDETGGDLGPLRTITYGSSPIAPGLLARAVERFGVDFHQGYGMTELSGNAVFLNAEEHRRGLIDQPHLLRAAGRPGPEVQVVLLDDDGHEVPAGQVGEVAVRAPQVMKGYWEAPEANAEAFHDGWFRTGDVGRIDADGRLSIVDRKKDIIVSGGENVSSREVEDRLAAHPDIAEVAVVGAPDARWGEVVCAVVVPRPGRSLTEDDVLAHGRATIGGFQQPRRVVLIEALPRNGSGKVLKHLLRDWAAAADLAG